MKASLTDYHTILLTPENPSDVDTLLSLIASGVRVVSYGHYLAEEDGKEMLLEAVIAPLPVPA